MSGADAVVKAEDMEVSLARRSRRELQSYPNSESGEEETRKGQSARFLISSKRKQRQHRRSRRRPVARWIRSGTERLRIDVATNCCHEGDLQVGWSLFQLCPQHHFRQCLTNTYHNLEGYLFVSKSKWVSFWKSSLKFFCHGWRILVCVAATLLELFPGPSFSVW